MASRVLSSNFRLAETDKLWSSVVAPKYMIKQLRLNMFLKSFLHYFFLRRGFFLITFFVFKVSDEWVLDLFAFKDFRDFYNFKETTVHNVRRWRKKRILFFKHRRPHNTFAMGFFLGYLGAHDRKNREVYSFLQSWKPFKRSVYVYRLRRLRKYHQLIKKFQCYTSSTNFLSSTKELNLNNIKQLFFKLVKRKNKYKYLFTSQVSMVFMRRTGIKNLLLTPYNCISNLKITTKINKLSTTRGFLKRRFLKTSKKKINKYVSSYHRQRRKKPKRLFTKWQRRRHKLRLKLRRRRRRIGNIIKFLTFKYNLFPLERLIYIYSSLKKSGWRLRNFKNTLKLSPLLQILRFNTLFSSWSQSKRLWLLCLFLIKSLRSRVNPLNYKLACYTKIKLTHLRKWVSINFKLVKPSICSNNNIVVGMKSNSIYLLPFFLGIKKRRLRVNKRVCKILFRRRLKKWVLMKQFHFVLSLRLTNIFKKYTFIYVIFLRYFFKRSWRLFFRKVDHWASLNLRSPKSQLNYIQRLMFSFMFGFKFKKFQLFLRCLTILFLQYKRRQRNIIMLFKKVIQEGLFNLKNVHGMKFYLHGKMNRRPRAKRIIFYRNRKPALQNISLNIDYYSRKLISDFGAYTFRLWVYYI